MRNIFISGIFVSFALFIGRMSGFLREVFVASTFGASSNSDLVIILLSIPDVLVNLLVGGALGMVVLPELKRLDSDKAKKFYLQVLYLCALIFSVFAFILSFFSFELLSLFAPGMNQEISSDASFFLKLSLCAIPLTVIAGVTTAYLNHQYKFIIPAFGTLIFNLVVIFVLWISRLHGEEYFLYYLSLGICLAALIRWIFFLANDKFYLFERSFYSERLVNAQLIMRYVYCVLSNGFLFFIPVMIRANASNEGDGVLSLASYALKLVDFPLAVFLTVFSVVFLPKLSALFIDKNLKQFSHDFWNATSALVFLSGLITVSVIMFPYQFTALVYKWGGLTDENIVNISGLVSIAMFSLMFQGVNSFLISAHAARQDTLIPFVITTIAVVIFSIVSSTLSLGLVQVLHFMNLCYALITCALLVSIYFRHKVNDFSGGGGRFFRVIAIIFVNTLVLVFVKKLDLGDFQSACMALSTFVLSVIALLFVDKNLRFLVVKNG